MSEIYRRKVVELEVALNDERIRGEAAEVLRGLIDRIELEPRADGSGVEARLHGALAAILAFCDEHNKKRPGTEVPGRQLSVVAGACNHRELTLPAVPV